MKKKLKIILLLAMMLPTATYAAEKQAVNKDHTANQEAAGRSILITVATAVTSDLELWQSSEGQLEAITSPKIAAEVGGRIIAVSVDVGKEVVAGQELAMIDPVDFRLAKELVSADIKRLQSLILAQQLQVKRLQALVSKKSANQSSLDEAQAQLGALKAQLTGAKVRFQQAERNILKTHIISPVSGIVDERKISVGDYVQAGIPLFHITTRTHLRAWLPFPESMGTQLRVGLPAKLRSPVAPDRQVLSRITGIRPEISQTSRAINVIIDLDNPGGWQPGASVTGVVRVGLHKDAIVVPESSIIRRPSGLVVYRVKNSKVQEVVVTTGVRQDDKIEILSGVQVGDQLALDGAAYLTDGVTVEVQNTAHTGTAE